MRDLLIQLFLLIVGGIVFLLLFVVGLVYTFGKHMWLLDWSPKKQALPIVRNITLLLDGLANSGAGELLNDVYKIEGNITYGKWNQTISATTGLIYIYKKDTKLRLVLDKVLGKNHCTTAISQEDAFYYGHNK